MKILIGFTLFISLSSFGSDSVKDLTWNFATYTEEFEKNENTSGRIVVTGFNVVEDLSEIRCIKNLTYDQLKEGSYMSDEHHSEHKTIKIEAQDYSGNSKNSKVVFQAYEGDYSTGEILASLVTLGFADEFTRGNKLHKRAIGYMNNYLSSLNSKIPTCSK